MLAEMLAVILKPVFFLLAGGKPVFFIPYSPSPAAFRSCTRLPRGSRPWLGP